MGDGADMALEMIEDFEYSRALYRSGQMTELEAYEAGIIDERGFEYSDGPPSKTCRCCGKAGLYWGLRDGHWRLFDNRGIHRCPVNPLCAKFEEPDQRD